MEQVSIIMSENVIPGESDFSSDRHLMSPALLNTLALAICIVTTTTLLDQVCMYMH